MTSSHIALSAFNIIFISQTSRFIHPSIHSIKSLCVIQFRLIISISRAFKKTLIWACQHNLLNVNFITSSSFRTLSQKALTTNANPNSYLIPWLIIKSCNVIITETRNEWIWMVDYCCAHSYRISSSAILLSFTLLYFHDLCLELLFAIFSLLFWF